MWFSKINGYRGKRITMKKRSKRYKALMTLSNKEKRLSVKEILGIVKKSVGTKFDESVDVSLRINLKQSKGGDFSLRTVVKLPNGSGKKEKVAVLCDPDKISDSKKVEQIFQVQTI